MANPKSSTVKRSLIVVAALILGECMPYIARIPLGFIYGADRIWRHTPDLDNFLRWNGMHIASLVPMGIFGLIYIFGNYRAAFYASVAGHVLVTSLIYLKHGQPYGPDDFLGCIVYPFVIGGGSFICGSVALVAAEVITKRQTPKSGGETDLYPA